MSYVYEGQRVFVPIRNRWVPCVVVCAMGDTARVVNHLHQIDTWFRVDQLRAIAVVNGS